jgi:hypothetical protein
MRSRKGLPRWLSTASSSLSSSTPLVPVTSGFSTTARPGKFQEAPALPVERYR